MTTIQELYDRIQIATEAANQYATAQQKLSAARQMKLQEVTEEGDRRFVSKERMAANLLATTQMPDGVIPAGRSTKEERETAVKAWMLQNHAEYRRLMQDVEAAELEIQLATASLNSAERQSHAANSAVYALKAVVEYETALVQLQTEQLKVKGVGTEVCIDRFGNVR